MRKQHIPTAKKRTRPRPEVLQGQAEITRRLNGFGGKMMIDHGACSCCLRDEKIYRRVMDRKLV